MPFTTLSDVWVPEVFASYQTNDPVESSDFIQSGVAVAAPAFNELANGPGRITTMPFWNPLDYTIEPNYDNDVYTDIAEPQKVNTGEMIARVSDLNEGWNSPDLVTTLSGKDPLKMVAGVVDGYWTAQFQRRCIATAIGVYNDNVAANGSDMVIDISDAAAAVDAANRISATTMTSAMLTLGDRYKNLKTIVMHSIVFGGLLASEQIVYVRPSQGPDEIPTYLGKRVIVDDGMPVVGGNGTTISYKYLSIVFGAGAFGYGKGTPKTPQEFQRAADRGNGGGTETLWIRKRWIIHPFGYSFTSATITGPGLAPTWADLKLATNWTRVANRKDLPLAFIVSNG
jgi:hypothetical protein